jgi:hypothetical protein
VKHTFRVPGGQVLALIGVVIFALPLLGELVFADYARDVDIAVAAFIVATSLYYILHIRKTQFFSPEEQKVFLKAYIVNCKWIVLPVSLL